MTKLTDIRKTSSALSYSILYIAPALPVGYEAVKIAELGSQSNLYHAPPNATVPDDATVVFDGTQTWSWDAIKTRLITQDFANRILRSIWISESKDREGRNMVKYGTIEDRENDDVVEIIEEELSPHNFLGDRR